MRMGAIVSWGSGERDCGGCRILLVAKIWQARVKGISSGFPIHRSTGSIALSRYAVCDGGLMRAAGNLVH